MDEPKKAPSNETDTRAEKPIAVLATADKGQTVVNYITRVQPASPETKQALGAPVQELVVVKNLAKILKFYSTMIKQGETSANKNLLYSGNVIVNKNFQDIEFITKLLEVDEAGKEFSMFVIDIERILIDFKEFSIIMDDFFDYVKINIPSIIFLYNSDAFLSKAYKARETSAFTTFSINFSRFFVERNVRNDKIVLVVVSDNPKTIDKRLLNSIDFMVDMDVPTREEREFYLKHLFEPEASVNFAMITDEMDEWTWGDIESFAKHAMIQKQSMEMKELSTKFLLDALHGENGLDRFDPPSVKLQKGLSRSKIDDDEPRGTTSTAAKKEPPIMANASIPASSPGRPDDPFKELLWQSAAEQDYDALIRTLDHLEKGVYVQEDRSLLFRYPFLLEDEVLVAKRKLEAAKNKIDMIKKHFKGVNRS